MSEPTSESTAPSPSYPTVPAPGAPEEMPAWFHRFWGEATSFFEAHILHLHARLDAAGVPALVPTVEHDVEDVEAGGDEVAHDVASDAAGVETEVKTDATQVEGDVAAGDIPEAAEAAGHDAEQVAETVGSDAEKVAAVGEQVVTEVKP